MSWKSLVIAALSIAVVAAPSSLYAQEGKQQASDSTETKPFAPVWTNYMRAKETDISVGSKMESDILLSNGWRFMNSIDISKKNTRGRDIQEASEVWNNIASKIVPDTYILNINIGDVYSKRTTLGLARFGKDIVFEDQRGTVNFIYTRALLKAKKSRFGFNVEAGQGTRDFKFDRNAAVGTGGAVVYSVGDFLNISGSAGFYGKREKSRVGDINFSGLPSTADTFKVKANLGRGEKKVLKVSYSRADVVERKITPPRGNSLEILDKPEDAKREKASKLQEKLELISEITPLSFLTINFKFNHSLNSQKYLVDARLSKEVKSDNISASTEYKYCSRGKIKFNISMNDADNDYGPTSVSSFREKEKSLGFSLSHAINDSLRFSLSGSGTLKQRFFKKYASNPRDVDYLYYNLDFRFHSAPFRKFSTDVSITTNRNQTINIDATLSKDNRVDYLYRVMPEYKFTPAPWVTISQKYTIKIEYTDFVYKEEENYINRTTSLVTDARFSMFRRLRFSFSHSYLMKDTGSYLPRNGERLYNRNSENLEHRIDLKTEYRPSDGFAVKATANFRNQRNSRFGIRDGERVRMGVRIYESGGLKVGFERKKKFGENGALNFDISYVKNFGPYLSEERKQYWLVDANIAFQF